MAKKTSKITRRHSLRIIGAGSAALGLLGLTACGGEEEAAAGGGGGGATGCATPLDAQSTQLRQTLQYVEQSANAEQNCANCAQFVADQYGDCGGCGVMTGPVQPQGHCLSWAAMAAEEPATPAAEEPAPAEEAAETEEG